MERVTDAVDIALTFSSVSTSSSCSGLVGAVGAVRVQARLRRVKGMGASANGGGIGRCWKAKGGMRITKATLIAITVKVFQRF